MSTEQAAAPTIKNAGTVPIKARKLFVNIPVSDVQKSIEFFEGLGFAFNPQFTDASATCMLVGTDAYFMLMVKDRFAGFSKKPMGDSQSETNGIYAITMDSREEVDALYAKALAAGATKAADPQDHGFMYVQSFYDLDGHHWELFWMDPASING
ncbi:MAG: VOC family protein [Gemmatimonas sp.]